MPGELKLVDLLSLLKSSLTPESHGSSEGHSVFSLGSIDPEHPWIPTGDVFAQAADRVWLCLPAFRCDDSGNIELSITAGWLAMLVRVSSSVTSVHVCSCAHVVIC